jgi:hypothetical protein
MMAMRTVFLVFTKFGKTNYCREPIVTVILSICVGFMLSLRGESGC